MVKILFNKYRDTQNELQDAQGVYSSMSEHSAQKIIEVSHVLQFRFVYVNMEAVIEGLGWGVKGEAVLCRW